MRLPFTLPRLIDVVTIVALFLLPGHLPADTLVEADGTVNQAKNLARLNVGAHIDRINPGGCVEAVSIASDSNENPAALILDDNTLSCPLPQGDTTFIITLPRISVLQRFAFINQNAAAQGNFELAVSNYRLGSTDPKWQSVHPPMKFGGSRLFNMPVLGVEAKYVRLTFHVRKEGRLAGVALYGSRTLEGFADRSVLRAETSFSIGAMKLVTHLEDTLNFNFANSYARARIAYISSGGAPAALRMIDDDISTSFSFDPEDKHPTVIVALANRQSLHRVSALYEMGQGQFEVYLLDELGSMPGDLSKARLIASVTGQNTDGNAAVDFDARGARYIALRWTRKTVSKEPVKVSEIAAFGTVPLSILNLEEVPESFVQNFTGVAGAYIIPPELAPVSP